MHIYIYYVYIIPIIPIIIYYVTMHSPNASFPAKTGRRLPPDDHRSGRGRGLCAHILIFSQKPGRKPTISPAGSLRLRTPCGIPNAITGSRRMRTRARHPEFPPDGIRRIPLFFTPVGVIAEYAGADHNYRYKTGSR